MVISIKFLISLLSGILPASLWLWFWLKEDKKHPEPKKKIIIAFIAGMVAVLLVLPLEKLIYSALGPTITIFTILSWAAAEEILKFLGAFLSSFYKNRDYDEPIDSMIYLISAALGFSAVENAFFLLHLIDSGQITQSIMSGNMRFIGATLLHTVSSATVGFFMSLSFYKGKEVKKSVLLFGLMVAIALHTIFNLLIIKSEDNLFMVFSGVWVLVIALMFIFEKVKTIKPRD